MGYTEAVTRTASCTGTQGVGLWQWITTSNDGLSQAFSLMTVCRYGEGYWNTEPKCPYNACKDEMCETCYDGWKEE